ncbi:MAG: hypothetical protein ACMUIE_07605 [Thermoplasmatota archaeon]
MEESTDKPQCSHIMSHKDKSVWVKPHPSEKIHAPSQKKSYCVICGKMKYQGSARAKKMGFYINLLKEIQRKAEVLRRRGITKHKLTQVQIRLILKELQEDDFFTDHICTNRYDQWERFKQTLNRYCPLPEEAVEPVYRDFKG